MQRLAWPLQNFVELEKQDADSATVTVHSEQLLQWVDNGKTFGKTKTYVILNIKFITFSHFYPTIPYNKRDEDIL